MLFSTAILIVIGLCFALGALDFILGGRLKLGPVFAQTFHKLGAVALGVMGLYSLAPAAADAVKGVLAPVAQALRMDPAAFPSLLFPIDMGGWGLCTGMAQDPRLGAFFGAVAASTFGATVGYCIPVSSGLIDKEMHPELALGTLSGLVAIPIGLMVAGLAGGVDLSALLWNLAPTIAFSALLCLGLLRAPAMMTKIFTGFGRVMGAIGLGGIVLQALRALNIGNPLPQMAPLDEAAAMVVRLVIIMAGAMVMITILTRFLRRPMDALGRKMGADADTVSGLMVATVSALIIYSEFSRYPRRGRVLLAAFCASSAFLFGGQLGFVSGLAPDMLTPFFVAKLLSGALAIPLALLLSKKAIS